MKRLLVTTALMAFALGAGYSTSQRALELTDDVVAYAAYDVGPTLRWNLIGSAHAQGSANPGTSYTCPNRPSGDNTTYCANTKFVHGAVAGIVIVPTSIALASGQIIVGQVSGFGAAETMSGDCTIVASGAITCTKLNGVSPGTAYSVNTGTSGATIPLNNGGFTQSGAVNFTSTFQVGGFTMTFPGAAASLTQSIGTTTIAMATGAITSGTCTSAQTGTITGALTSDVAQANFVGDVSAVTGIAANATTGNIYILGPWVSASNTVTIKECNSTALSITPGAHSILVKVTR